jgi:hypothetical protein
VRVDLSAHSLRVCVCPAQRGNCPLVSAVAGSGDPDMVQLLSSEYPAAINLPNEVMCADSYAVIFLNLVVFNRDIKLIFQSC